MALPTPSELQRGLEENELKDRFDTKMVEFWGEPSDEKRRELLQLFMVVNGWHGPGSPKNVSAGNTSVDAATDEAMEGALRAFERTLLEMADESTARRKKDVARNAGTTTYLAFMAAMFGGLSWWGATYALGSVGSLAGAAALLFAGFQPAGTRKRLTIAVAAAAIACGAGAVARAAGWL